jgi:predicted nucleic acid-binding Zn ribbon protein
MDRIGNDLRRSLAATGVTNVGQLAELTEAWPTAVGAAIARAAWPQRVTRDGTLLVATVSSAWANELTLLAEEILAKVAAVAGPATPTGLRFAVGPVPSPAADPEALAPRPAVSPDAAELEVAGDVSSAIEDPELRKMVQKAIAASLASRRSDTRV